MGLSVEFLKSCCASIAKILTFASFDPLLGTPTGNPMEYLLQHNLSFEDFRLYYREALQKGAYMIEMALQESERMDANILLPFLEEYHENKQKVCDSVVLICKKIRTEEILGQLLRGWNQVEISQALQDVGKSNCVYTTSEELMNFLSSIMAYDSKNIAFSFLLEKGYLFQAIDYQLRLALSNDSRFKNIAGFTSSMKMKVRTHILAKQITNLEKRKDIIDPSELKNFNQQLEISKQSYQSMTEYYNNQRVVVDLINSLLLKLEQSVGSEILEKTKSLPLVQMGNFKDTIEILGTGDSLDEISRLLQNSIDLLNLQEDRIEFSHNLLGSSLDSQQAKIEKAKNIFEKIPNNNSQKAILANRLGVILNAMEMPEQASEYFRRSLVLLPSTNKQERSYIESNLFYTLLNRGHFDAALKYMIESLSSGSEDCNFFDVERYRPKKILGVGGVGITFLCEDVCEERMVVIKALWQYESGILKDIFPEAFQMQQINDDRIAKIYDIQRHHFNHSFLVTEHCNGIDLVEYIKQQGKPLDILDALNIIEKIAQGLMIAHKQTPPIFHGYIKPNNILYSPDTNTIKIIDIGVSKMMPKPQQMQSALTGKLETAIAINVVNTWNYMSPEQQNGDINITEKADVFSLGKTLLFLLTGQNPPPENIFLLQNNIRSVVGEFLNRCFVPEIEERCSLEQFLNAIDELRNKIPAISEKLEANTKDSIPVEDEFFSIEKENFETLEEEPMESSESKQMQANDWNDMQTSDEQVPESLFDSAAWEISEPTEVESNVNVLPNQEFDLSGGMDLSAGADLSGGMDLSAGADLSGGMDLSAGADLSGGMDLSAGADLSGGMDLSAGADLSGGMDLSAGADLSSGMDLSAGADLSSGMDLSAGAEVAGYDNQMNDQFASAEVAGYDNQMNDQFAGAEVAGYDNQMNNQFAGSEVVGYDNQIDTQIANEPTGTVDEFAGGAELLGADDGGAELLGADEPLTGGAVAYGLDDFNLEGDPLEQALPTGQVTETIRVEGTLPKCSLPSGYNREGETIVCEKDGATMIYVPAGTFNMGCEGSNIPFEEGPVHEVHLDGYLIDQYPVTWYQYELFCEETNREKPKHPCWEIDDAHPVVNVSWDDAMAYAYWAGKSLPTEAQWEKAAKGGFSFDGDALKEQRNSMPDRRFPWGDDYPNHTDEWVCNCLGEFLYGGRSTSPVGHFKNGASPYGCMDMAGNVWEWCTDWYNETYYKTSPDKNPRGPKSGSGHVVRGGAWNMDMDKIRVSYRTWMEQDKAWNVIGFRTVKQLMI